MASMIATMRERCRRWAAAFAERLTVPERWMVLAILLVAVFGAAIKYCRQRPELLPPVVPVPAGSSPLIDDN
jgi:hypothetical protein